MSFNVYISQSWWKQIGSKVEVRKTDTYEMNRAVCSKKAVFNAHSSRD